MNLVINETSKVEFSISIAGTQMKPSEVRLVLGDGAQLVFKAMSQDGVNYSVLVTPLKEVLGTVCRLRIEVLFGEKIFTPINRMVSISDVEPTVVCPEPEVTQPVEVPKPQPEEEIVRPPEVQPEFSIEVPTKVEEPEEDEQPHKNAPVEVKKIHEEVRIPGPIPSLFFELTSTPKEKEVVVVVEEKVEPPKPKVQRKPLKKLTEKKPTGVEIDTLKVSKSIFVESEKIPLTITGSFTPSTPIVKESATPFPIIIQRKEVVYL
jgi:hypothetical protein